MTYGNTQKQNHPKKGSSIRVGPIQKTEDITRIKQSLAHKPRDFCLFTLGINTAYRANEILSLTVGQVAHLKYGDPLILLQSKNNEERMTTINNNVYRALQNWLAEHPNPKAEAPLFQSQRTHKALVVSTLSRMVKKWCREMNLPGNYASHSLRKTWGFHQLRENKDTEKYILIVLMVAYGHATQKQTLSYLSIQSHEVKSLYLDTEL